MTCGPAVSGPDSVWVVVELMTDITHHIIYHAVSAAVMEALIICLRFRERS